MSAGSTWRDRIASILLRLAFIVDPSIVIAVNPKRRLEYERLVGNP